MNPKFPFVSPRPYPNSFVLVVQLRGAPTLRQRHDFFARMHSEARRHGLVMGHKLGLCVFLGAERLCTGDSRHRMLMWLVDHLEVAAIDVGDLMPLANLFRAGDSLTRRLGSLQTVQREAVREIVLRAGWGAVQQWAAYLWGAL